MSESAPVARRARERGGKPLPPISCVVIGRNEGPRLRAAFEAILAADYPRDRLEIIYVDTDSTDGSAGLARHYADKIIVARLPGPRPGLARNLGWKEARFDLVHFIDGDTVLDPGWLRQAVRAVEEQDTFCVFGRIEEIDPERNIYHRAHALEWERPLTEEPRTSGGTVLIRTHLLRLLGGFDETLEAGEEPDLSTRARIEGFRLVHLNRPMARHDMKIRGFRDYWRRAVRTGRAYAEIGSRYRRSRIPLWREELRASLFQLFALLFYVATTTPWTGPLLPLGWLAALGTVLVCRKYLEARRLTADRLTALAHALHVYLVKVPMWVGQLGYFLGRARQRLPRWLRRPRVPASARILETWSRETAGRERART